MKNFDIVILGSGASGCMCALSCENKNLNIAILDKNKLPAKKLMATGNGRCNLTNASDIESFLQNVTKNPRFLYSALNNLSPYDTIDFFESLGVKVKIERGNRVFPESDKAIDVVNALLGYSSGCTVIHEKVKSVIPSPNGGFKIVGNKEYLYDKVIIATGGKSYPLTGSDGSGYRLAIKLGHTVTELTPSLIPICSPSDMCRRMQGLSLKNVGIKVFDQNDNIIYTDFGEMMFTHFGVTGPVILSASSHVRSHDISKLTLSIDLKPALDDEMLDARLISDFIKFSNKDYINSLSDLLPSKMIPCFVSYTGIDERKKVNSITKEERAIILKALKNFNIPLSGFRPIEEAIITSGGISVKEINPKSMQSKIIPGLFFAGEVIDVDAYTGGFNLQIAFSTGYLAGKNAAE